MFRASANFHVRESTVGFGTKSHFVPSLEPFSHNMAHEVWPGPRSAISLEKVKDTWRVGHLVPRVSLDFEPCGLEESWLL